MLCGGYFAGSATGCQHSKRLRAYCFRHREPAGRYRHLASDYRTHPRCCTQHSYRAAHRIASPSN